jgi:N-acetylglucosaminyldiphosphoundecaprenol N-acetyl-beta-D-mannosaminyltransferase
MIKKDRKQVKILGIALDSTSRAGVLREARVKLSAFERGEVHFKPFYIVTPNPEIILQAQKDKVLSSILNSADFAVPDGVGLSQAAFFLSQPDIRFFPLRLVFLPFAWFKTVFLFIFNRNRFFSNLQIIKGRHLFEGLIFLANKKGWRVVLLGDDKESAQKASYVLKNNYKKVKIFAFSGPALGNDGLPLNQDEKTKENKILDKINEISPHLLFVGFGAPKQEKWLYLNLPKLKVGGAMVVGGTFDYISGKMKKPPKFFEKIGLEWFWRLLLQPKRIVRIFRAVFIFPWSVFVYKLKKGIDRPVSF